MPGGLFWAMGGYAARLAAPVPVLVPGDVAFDAFTKSSATEQNTTPMTLSHTPVGTPRGVVVFVVAGAQSVDEVTGVTYGGQAMTRVAIAQDTAIEPGITYAYFLGTGIPTGTQTVSVAFDATAPNGVKVIGCYTLTGNNDLEVADFDVVQEDAASPVQVTLSTGGKSGIAVAGFYSGRNDDTLTAPIGSTTEDGTFALSAAYHAAWGHTAVSTSDLTIGWTATATDDAALVGVMVVDPGGSGGGGGALTPLEAYDAAVAARNPVAYYRHQEGAGSTMNDASSNANHGSYIGSPTLGVAGPFSGAGGVAYDGVGQYGSAPYSAALDFAAADDFAIVMWVKMASWATSQQYFLGRGGNGNQSDYELRKSGVANNLEARFGDGTTLLTADSDTDATIADSAWHMIGYSVDRTAGTCTFRIDADLDYGTTDISAYAVDLVRVNQVLYIARRQSLGYVAASLALVSIHAQKLTDADWTAMRTAAGF